MNFPAQPASGEQRGEIFNFFRENEGKCRRRAHYTTERVPSSSRFSFVPHYYTQQRSTLTRPLFSKGILINIILETVSNNLPVISDLLCVPPSLRSLSFLCRRRSATPIYEYMLYVKRIRVVSFKLC